VTPADVETLRALLDEMRAEWDAEYANCQHTGETLKFNGGNPWYICSDCGIKIRDAKYVSGKWV
jgi:hypothetical protein